MKTLVLSGYDDNMASVGDRCTRTHGDYARRNGFYHEVVRKYLPGTHPSYQKILLIAERIPLYDCILWLDADSVVTNPDAFRPGSVVGACMEISIDWCAPVPDDLRTLYVSCGNFVFYNTDASTRFLETWDRYSQPYSTSRHGCWEQDGLQAAMRSSEWFNRQVFRRPRKTLNSVHRTCVNGNFPSSAPMPWEPGDFLLHLTNVDRNAILTSMGL